MKETWEDEDLLDWPTPKPQLPSDPLRPLDLVFECMEEITNGHDKNVTLKQNNDEVAVDWLPSPKKLKMPSPATKPTAIPSFAPQKITEKPLSSSKPKKPVVNLSKERRQSTEKLHLKKPVCSSVHEESMPSKVSSKSFSSSTENVYRNKPTL